MEDQAREVVRVPVAAGGRLEMDRFKQSLEGAAYVSLMAANNETGVIQPLREAVELARERGLPIHSDAIQAVGKMPLNVKELGVDLLSMSAHKFHGPKGVGALFVREGLRFKPLLHGGGQEAGQAQRDGEYGRNRGHGRGGGVVADDCRKRLLATMRDAFEAIVLKEISGVWVNGDHDHRLPNTSHLSFDQCDAAGC